MRRYLYLGVFFAGGASLAVEMSASRLLGNYFGSSNLVWAVIIGLILIYLSVGYTIGGKWADRSPEFKTFFSILCWAALLIGLIPLASRPILRIASQAFDEMRVGVMAGSFISVLALFSLPVTLLGTASPICRAHRHSENGRCREDLRQDLHRFNARLFHRHFPACPILDPIRRHL